MKLFFDNQPVAQLNDALGRYRPGEFESPTRSTVPLISSLNDSKVWSTITGQLAVEYRSVEAHLEYKVKPPLGHGTASHTDVMLTEGSRAIAVEAKWTEPRYSEVGEWVNQVREGVNHDNDAQNRGDVMKGWLSLLQPYASKKLCLEDFSHAVYQMVHRAASACHAGRLPTLVYLQFSPLPSGCALESRVMDDLRYLHSLLGTPAGFPFWLVKVEAKPNPAFERIRKLPKGSPNTADAVRAALLGEPLFDFTDISVFPLQEAHCR
jgi:hypothetical protein